MTERKGHYFMGCIYSFPSFSFSSRSLYPRHLQLHLSFFFPLSSSSLATCPLSGNVRRKQRSRKSTCETRVRLTDSHGYCHNDYSKMSDSALSTFCTLCFFLGYPAQDFASLLFLSSLSFLFLKPLNKRLIQYHNDLNRLTYYSSGFSGSKDL